MKKILSISVANAMILLTASGFFVALAFSVPQISNLFSNYQKLQSDAKLTELAYAIGGLTHELQKERGASAGFLSSQGANFADALPKQRLVSDAAISTFLEAANAAENSLAEQSSLLKKLGIVREKITNLESLRDRVDRLDIELLDAVGRVTDLNRSAIGLLPELGKEITYADAARAVQRHAILMTAKDISGLERATGAAGFAQASNSGGVFPSGAAVRFRKLVQEQDVLYSLYNQIASDDLVEAISDFSRNQSTLEVNALREIALSGDPEQIGTVSAEVWFATISKKIDLIKAIEDLGAAELVEETSAALALAKSDLLDATMLLVLLLGAIGFMSTLLARSTVRAIVATSNRVGALADGDLDSEVPDVAPKDLRRITDALGVFRANELTRRDESTRQKDLEMSSVEGVKRMTKAVSEGDFSSRIRLRDLQGASKILGEGLNQIMEVAEEFVDGQRKRDLLALEEQKEIAATGQQTVNELNKVVAACVSGDFSRRLVTDGKEGVLADLCNGINRISDVTETGLFDVMEVLDSISSGDLSNRMSKQHEGIFLQMSGKFNNTSSQLSEIVGQISNGAKTMQGSSKELSEMAENLSERTEQTATSLEKTASSITDLTESLKTTSEGAKEVGQVARDTEQDTNDAVASVTRMVGAIDAIADSSASISKITNVIDDISFQTNLLALNAGVEAARAGEAGRGFAVVASEVRTLAQRAAEAAQDINDLIMKSETQVKSGVEIVDSSRATLEKIHSSISGMTKEVLTMVEAAEEQSEKITSINAAVLEMEETTRRNATMFDETENVVKAMSQEANELSQIVSHFSCEPAQSKKEIRPAIAS